MKKQKKVSMLIIIMILVIGFMTQQVYAEEKENLVKPLEYSEEFKNWLNLTEEQKEKSIMPRMYKIYSAEKEIYNPLKMARTSSTLISNKFNLKTYIPENMIIKNQRETESCWTFSSLGALETNLALQDYYNNKEVKNYDFSERHMEYATTRKFLNDEINENGFYREIDAGGSNSLALAYLTNGTGAIAEKDMPFKNSTEKIEVKEIQNKEVISEIYDTTEFPSTISEEKNKLKEFIKNNGGISTGIHEPVDSTDKSLNRITGAVYCNNANTYISNHAVLIVGWDDDYSIENFSEGMKPTNKGAWIVKDSHGTNAEWSITIDEYRNILFESNKSYYESVGITEASQIPDNQISQSIQKNGYILENEKVRIPHNDDGYLYVSYEDAKIYSSLLGIYKSENSTDYENIYQYNKFGTNVPITFIKNKIYLANIFEKNTNSKEYLTQVSISTPETVTCKVYVNPNGESKSKNNLQLVQLKAGESETFDAGYHTMEFSKPIEITENKFVVVVEIQGKRNDALNISTECNYVEYYKKTTGKEIDSKSLINCWNVVNAEKGKCFYTVENGFVSNSWEDLGTFYDDTNGNLPDCNSSIKAFTVSKIYDNTLQKIEIETPPNKTSYYEGENFDKTGMIIKAYYNSKNTPVVVLDDSSYNILNGTNLKENQKSVTIQYEGKSIEQPITVEKNTIVSLNIKTPPTKTEYKEGQSFDKTGMIIEATYKNGNKQEISDYTITNGNNLKANQTKVTITYKEKSIEQEITVTPNPLLNIKITKEPNKKQYVEGQNFDKTGMIVTGEFQDGSEEEIVEYTITNGTNLTETQTTITIEYEGKKVEQPITVEKKKIVSIEVSQTPSKLKYIENKEELNLDDGKIRVKYNDNTSEEIDMKNEQIKIEGFDNSKIGKQTLTITYQNTTTTLEIEIIEEAKPENSNMDNLKFTINSMKYYTFTDKNKKEYTIIDLSADGITINNNNDKNKYYYYLSGNKNEQNIEKWVEIEDIKTADGKMEFKIDTSDIQNYDEVSKSEKLYIYIKEVAIKGGNQSIIISKPVELNTNVKIETYLDNAKINNSNSSDETIAKGELPKTGIRSLIAIIIITTLIGIVLYIRYRELNKYVK